MFWIKMIKTEKFKGLRKILIFHTKICFENTFVLEARFDIIALRVKVEIGSKLYKKREVLVYL